jgi:hypothetical protein
MIRNETRLSPFQHRLIPNYLETNPESKLTIPFGPYLHVYLPLGTWLAGIFQRFVEVKCQFSPKKYLIRANLFLRDWNPLSLINDMQIGLVDGGKRTSSSGEVLKLNNANVFLICANCETVATWRFERFGWGGPTTEKNSILSTPGCNKIFILKSFKRKEKKIKRHLLPLWPLNFFHRQ